MFGGCVLQQTVGIPMGTNCAPLLADLFLYSYETDFIQGLLKKNEKKLTQSFNFTFRYIDAVYEITALHKQALTPISLKSGPFPLKFSKILQAHPNNSRSRASRITLISIPAYM